MRSLPGVFLIAQYSAINKVSLRYYLKLYNKLRYSILIVFASFLSAGSLLAQKEVVKNQPYADQKLFHLGFHVGLHSQDMIVTNNGVAGTDGRTWYAEIPSYSPGFTVGVIGDMYLNQFFNLRFSPTLHFGDKKFVFKSFEGNVPAGDSEFTTSLRSNYLTFPLDIKYSAFRMNNYRPYILGGIYGSFDLGRKKGNPLLLKGTDVGLEFGLGCDFYLPYFKLCPEIKFCFGLVDLLEKDRTDLQDESILKYSQSLSKATTRMIVLTFNFE